MTQHIDLIAIAVVQACVAAPTGWLAWRSRRDLGVARVREVAAAWGVLGVAAALVSVGLGLEALSPRFRMVGTILRVAYAIAAVGLVPPMARGLRGLWDQATAIGHRPIGAVLAPAALVGHVVTLLARMVAALDGSPSLVMASAIGGEIATMLLAVGTLTLLGAAERDAAVAAERRRSAASGGAGRTTGAFSAVIAAASDAVALVSPDGRYRTTNAAFDALMGRHPPGGHAAEFPFADPSTTAFRDAWRARFAAVAEGDPERFKRVLELDGEPRTFDIVISPAKSGDATDGALIWCRDVTEADALQEALAAREKYYRSLIEHSSDMIFVLLPDGSIRYASPSATRVLGLAMDEVRRVGLGDLAHPDDQAGLLAAIVGVQRAAARRRPQPLRLRRADGTYVELELAMSVFEDPRGQRSIIVNARDLTERRTLEQELLQAQRLDSLGRLAGGVAHDFNNLLTGLLAHVQFAQEEAADRPEALRELADVEATAKRAAEVTRQLLTFARRDRIAPTVFDANARLRDLARLLERTVGARVRLEIALAPEALPVRADAGQFEQAVLNLAVNARDAMPDGGTLAITSTRRPGTASLQGRQAVVVTVSDTGVGMSAEVQRHIFEPFYTTKAKGAGTGLGLASVYGMVTQAGGLVSVSSEVGAGTRFELAFPLHEGALDLAREVRKSAERAVVPATVLVVEDDPHVRRVTTRLLERRGYRVLEADGADAALAAWDGAAGAVDLLLTDVMMPGLLGGALAARLRGRAPTLAVAYMTGYDVDAVRRDPAVPAGPVIAKPFTEDDMLSVVQAALAARGQTGRA